MTRKALAIVIVAAGCLEPQLQPCGDSILCPAGTQCIEELQLCVTQDQLDACSGQPDGAICNVSGSIGECRDGICLIAICGDAFVEPGEMCDDGNTEPNDGCSASCASTEACGNGVLDFAQGEICDDGNRVSSDACGSTCQPEKAAWSLEGITPLYRGSAGHQAYDLAHQQLVHVTEGITWTWDGTRWSIVDATSLPTANWKWSRVVYAPDRMTTVLVGSIGLPTQNGTTYAWEWDGDAWHSTPILMGPFVGNPYVTYDTVRKTVLLVAISPTSYQLWSLDLGSGKWTLLPSPVGTPALHVGFGFDESRGRAVFTRLLGSSTETQEWNGTTWSSASTSGLDDMGTLVYDPIAGGVLSVGSTTWIWDGGKWDILAAARPPRVRSIPEVTFDRVRRKLVLFGGMSSQQRLDDLYEWDAIAWSVDLRAWPRDSGGNVFVAFDPRMHELLYLGEGDATGVETWTYDGAAWHEHPRRPTAPQALTSATAIAYDPVRGAHVTNALDRSTWLLRDHVWQRLEAPTTSAAPGVMALTYDPSRGGVVGVSSTATWLLESTASQWTMIGGPPISATLPGWIAFDARAGQLVMNGTYASGSVFDGQSWAGTVSPGRGFSAIANERRGTVELVSPDRPAYERIARTYVERERLPYAITGNPVYDASTGDLMIVGGIDSARVILRRKIVGSTATTDACAGADDDGDTLVDCADPECWWSCGTCPPFASCP